MITENTPAWLIEENDIITLGGDMTFNVEHISDDEDTSVTFYLSDEEGEKGEVTFLLDEPVAVVLSFQDPD